MKTKKYLVAIAIFGGALFLAQAANEYNNNAEQTAKIEKKPFPIPSAG
ncbi:hypothetical protein [Neotamlana laminarinivorans]|uniref:Uncharacterized protein n=1 Tax=Neotamlana laminarinivorans TaxID=2883124 RepID=A0A9X1L2J4_9FLAO|nr:hypothetical protein [Tamlana laminarinivorans]MCB4797654.1 hypothetical protein [Tamlana laminarinivorans]